MGKVDGPVTGSMIMAFRKALRLLYYDGVGAVLKKTISYVYTKYWLKLVAAVTGRSVVELRFKTRSGESLIEEGYAEQDGASEVLLELIETHGSNPESVLEIGCNIGRRLSFLHENGYQDLHGIEINPEAVAKMEQEFPNMYETANICIDSAQHAIKEFSDSSIDVVYSIAVLIHIQSDADSLYDDIARVAKDLVITIENENQNPIPRNEKEQFTRLNGDQYIKLRDYKDIFESRGFTEVDSFTAWGDDPRADKIAPLVTSGYNRCYVARVFQKD